MLLIALLIALDSPGPVIFWQMRQGRHGKPFRMAKFRTMVADAEQRLADLRHGAGLAGPVFKLRRDPRVTRAGRLLRRTSLDELPQLWNVLRGEMSLVGPRPLPLDQVDGHDQRFARRTEVQPGLTGLWQVSGRVMHVDYDKWLAMDLEYVERRSLRLDLVILAKTLPAMCHGDRKSVV